MQDIDVNDEGTVDSRPWNNAKLIGAKPCLRPKQVWAVRTTFQLEGRLRDLALFNLAIDNESCGCDLVSTRVEDVATRGYGVDRATIRQKKTGHPVKVGLTERPGESLDHYLAPFGARLRAYLFSGRGKSEKHMSTRQYARLLSDWLSGGGL